MNEQIIPESTLELLEAAGQRLSNSENTENPLYFSVTVLYAHSNAFSTYAERSEGSDAYFALIEELKRLRNILRIRVRLFNSPNTHNTRSAFDTQVLPFYVQTSKTSDGTTVVMPLQGIPNESFNAEITELKITCKDWEHRFQMQAQQYEFERSRLNERIETLQSENERLSRENKLLERISDLLDEKDAITERIREAESPPPSEPEPETKPLSGLGNINLNEILGRFAEGAGKGLAGKLLGVPPGGESENHSRPEAPPAPDYESVFNSVPENNETYNFFNSES